MATTNKEDSQEIPSKGRGWKGDPDGHARAGRLGGLARSRRQSGQSSTSEENK
ncbi:MAG: hypothetical protein NVSMB66_5990 [Candidatus Doudnabacteria bacterium]